ncbi:MAG: aspartate kinase [Planctomycetes bacterium]|nr:aspartate kinase [Planctomycetota bacterium]
MMKFGGTSVGGAAAIRQVVEVVRSQLERRPVVVVSAHSGVTDALLEVARNAARGTADIDAIVGRHREILHGLSLDVNLLDPLLEELCVLARGVRLVGESSPKVVDALLSYGERLSARVIAAALRDNGVEAEAVDSFTAGLRTDSSFGRARPLPDDGRILTHLGMVPGVPVVTGFLGADEHGNVTTLGRNGSDYSAALIGVAINAEEVQIWKDVDGVHTADPQLVPEARPIRRMSFADVADLASFGSKVLHPAAMVPAMQRGIPLRVRNTLLPDAEGTTIDVEVERGRPDVVAIAHRDHVALVTVRSHRLVPQHAFLAKVFQELDEAECDVGPVAVAEAAVTVAVEAPLAERAARRLRGRGEVQIEPGRAVVGVIGDASVLESGGIGQVLDELTGAGIAVRCAGLGALGSTVALTVESDRLADAVRLLHRRFFPDRT